MPPKKAKKGKKKEPPPPEPEPEPPLRFSDLSVAERDLDLLHDLNDEFFSGANKTIQNLMEAGRTYEASKIKKYVDILYNVHRKFAEEVKENEFLRPQVHRASVKLRMALELTLNSDEAMEKFKEALSLAWKESDASLLREQNIQEKMQDILMKCDNLESKEAKKEDDSAEFGNLAKYKNIILRERDRLNGEVTDLEKRLALQRFYSESLEYINKNCEDNMNKMANQVKILESEKQNFEVKIRNLMNNVEDQKEGNAKIAAKLEHCNRELNDTTKSLTAKNAANEQLKYQMEKLRNENSLNIRQLTKYEEEVVEFHRMIREQEETIRALRLEDKVKANNILQLTNKYKKATKDYDDISSKLYKQNRTNHTLNEDISRFKNTIDALEKDLLSSGQKWEDMRRLKENVQRERDTLRSDMIKLNNNIADLKHTMVIQSNNIDLLRMDTNKMNVKLDEAKIIVSKAEKERDEMAQEVETLNERIEYFQEQVQLKGDQVNELSDKMTQKNTQLFNLKKQLEVVHSDKMLLRRTLDTCTQERDNFRNLQIKTAHQISQLTTEIACNQNNIISLNLKIERLNNDKKELQTEIKTNDAILAGVRKELKEMKAKTESLMKTIDDDEYKFMKIKQDLDETRKEKNLIGLQMMRRNDEIVLLKDKFGIMQTALDQGQTQYNLRVGDIRLLKMEIKNLQTERDCLTRAMSSTADMRQEIVRLQRLLNQERIKCRALMEDAKTPTGVHRWRILKGQDPSRFKLLEKVQMLQRRNLKQEIQKTNLEQLLEEKQKLCDSLKKVIEDMPKTDIKQKLLDAQKRNREQLKKLKALSAELIIDEVELKARECIIEEFKKSLKTANTDVCVKCAQQLKETLYSSSTYVEKCRGNYLKCVFESSETSQIILKK